MFMLFLNFLLDLNVTNHHLRDLNVTNHHLRDLNVTNHHLRNYSNFFKQQMINYTNFEEINNEKIYYHETEIGKIHQTSE